VLVTAPPGDDRLFVVEQRGAIRIYRGEALAAQPFLDLSADARGELYETDTAGNVYHLEAGP
jgi:hypothetical protein